MNDHYLYINLIQDKVHVTRNFITWEQPDVLSEIGSAEIILNIFGQNNCRVLYNSLAHVNGIKDSLWIQVDPKHVTMLLLGAIPAGFIDSVNAQCRASREYII